MQIKNHHNKKNGHICLKYIRSKMLSSSLDTSPQKLFAYDFVTMYIMYVPYPLNFIHSCAE